jgi:hypothetical protein
MGQEENPRTTVEARLMKEGDSVVIFIKDAPIEVTKARMPGTYEKLVKLIEKDNPSEASS